MPPEIAPAAQRHEKTVYAQRRRLRGEGHEGRGAAEAVRPAIIRRELQQRCATEPRMLPHTCQPPVQPLVAQKVVRCYGVRSPARDSSPDVKGWRQPVR